MLWRDALDRLDREAAAAELAQLKVVGVGNLVRTQLTKTHISELVEQKFQELIGLASSDSRLRLSDSRMREVLLDQIYSRAWTARGAKNPDREALEQAVRGVESKPKRKRKRKAKRRGLAGVDDATLEERLLQGYLERLATSLKDQNIDFDALTREVRDKLGEAQWNELRQVLGLDTLTADGIATLTKMVAAGSAGAMAVNAAGFVAYTALTATMASVAAAVGVTLPFGAFVSATTTMAFLTGPFAVVAIGTVGLIPVVGLNRKVAHAVLANTLVSLRISGAGPNDQRGPTTEPTERNVADARRKAADVVRALDDLSRVTLVDNLDLWRARRDAALTAAHNWLSSRDSTIAGLLEAVTNDVQAAMCRAEGPSTTRAEQLAAAFSRAQMGLQQAQRRSTYIERRSSRGLRRSP